MPVVFDNAFLELHETGVDANAATLSATVDVAHYKNVAIGVAAETGSNATVVVVLQCSLDGVTWDNTDHEIAQNGAINAITMVLRYVRLKVKTVEGSAGTIEWRIQAK